MRQKNIRDGNLVVDVSSVNHPVSLSLKGCLLLPPVLQNNVIYIVGITIIYVTERRMAFISYADSKSFSANAIACLKYNGHIPVKRLAQFATIQ